MSTRHKVRRAVIPAAGLGTRMLPATKALSKEMLPVAGKPLIQHAVEEAAASGIETVILVLRNKQSLVPAHFAFDPQLESYLLQRHLIDEAALLRRSAQLIDLQYVEQGEPLGLADAILRARPLLSNEPFLVLLPDVIMVSDPPVARQLMQLHDSQGGSVVAIRQVELDEIRRHGIVRLAGIVREDLDPYDAVRITGLVEKPSLGAAPSRFGVFGRYLLEPCIWEAIAQTRADAGGEIQLTDALHSLCQNNLLSGLCFAGQHFDAGDPLGYLKANVEFALREPSLSQPLKEFLSRRTA